MGPVLMGIMAETSSMLSHVMQLEKNLRASADQVANLQQDLKTAWREARTDGSPASPTASSSTWPSAPPRCRPASRARRCAC
jgi:hypothetical protein